jgi:DNA repair exonuclease SbcCD ATPase subunit
VADPVEDAVGRLYGLPLEDFTRERDAIARELRRAKDREAADTVSKLPKPTQAAWAANHLARERRDLVDDLLAAGDSLREAQDSAMSGKGAALLREAGAAERAAVEALVDAAKDLRPAGRRPSEATLERLRTTLHAAAGNEEVREALAAGRLVEDAEATSAWGLLDMAAVAADEETSAAPARRRPPRARAATKRRGKERTPEEREAAAREAEERAAAEQAERERRQQLEAELREARAERRAHERELGRAEREAERAAARLESALQAAEQARAQVDEANDEFEAAREAAEEARDRVARLEEQLD